GTTGPARCSSLGSLRASACLFAATPSHRGSALLSRLPALVGSRTRRVPCLRRSAHLEIPAALVAASRVRRFLSGNRRPHRWGRRELRAIGSSVGSDPVGAEERRSCSA